MSLDRNKLRFTRLALAALFATGAVSAAANVLVVRSSGPSAKSYPPGRSLPDNASITLRANDRLVVLGPSGTRTFTGPGTFSPSAPVAATRTAQVLTTSGRRARVGAVRDPGLIPRSPTLWHVDATKAGTVCVPESAAVTLWRPDASDTVTLSIAPVGGGGATSIEWPAGEPTLAWPAALPVRSGADYQLRWDGAAQPVRIRFRTIDETPTDRLQVANVLIENGCDTQLDLLVETAPQS